MADKPLDQPADTLGSLLDAGNSAAADTVLANPLLLQLRDIHPPSTVSSWPLAPGWWLIGLLLMSVLAISLMRLVRRRRSKHYQREASNCLVSAFQHWEQDRDNTRYLQEVNKVLRRLALTVESRTAVASLTGLAWRQALQRLSRTKFSEATWSAISEQGYVAQPVADIPKTHRELTHWLAGHD